MDAQAMDWATKLGMGGAAMWFALQIYSKTVDFLGKKKDAPTPQDDSGSKAPEFWINQFREIVKESIKANVQDSGAYWRSMDDSLERSVAKPLSSILERQTEILEKLAETAIEERARKRGKD
jgi:hypothetical protein